MSVSKRDGGTVRPVTQTSRRSFLHTRRGEATYARPNRLFDQKSYAKLLGVGRSTLYAMIADGLIVARKLGTKSIRIFHEDNIGFRDRFPGGNAGADPGLSQPPRSPA